MKNIAVITGASSGMGREFAYRLLEEEHPDEIWLIARDKEKLDLLAEQSPEVFRAFSADLVTQEGRKKISEALRAENEGRQSIRISYLINSAGTGRIGRFEEMTEIDIDSMVSLNCQALMTMTSLCLPFMYAGSRIAMMASGSAFLPQPGFAVYAATKSCVLSFSRALRQELKKRRITVTAICPGPVDTDFFSHTGQAVPEWKKPFTAKPEKVVRRAFYSVRRGKAVCTPSVSMKAVMLVSKVIPHNWLLAGYRKF